MNNWTICWVRLPECSALNGIFFLISYLTHIDSGLYEDKGVGSIVRARGGKFDTVYFLSYLFHPHVVKGTNTTGSIHTGTHSQRQWRHIWDLHKPEEDKNPSTKEKWAESLPQSRSYSQTIAAKRGSSLQWSETKHRRLTALVQTNQISCFLVDFSFVFIFKREKEYEWVGRESGWCVSWGMKTNMLKNNVYQILKKIKT